MGTLLLLEPCLLTFKSGLCIFYTHACHGEMYWRMVESPPPLPFQIGYQYILPTNKSFLCPSVAGGAICAAYVCRVRPLPMLPHRFWAAWRPSHGEGRNSRCLWIAQCLLYWRRPGTTTIPRWSLGSPKPQHGEKLSYTYTPFSQLRPKLNFFPPHPPPPQLHLAPLRACTEYRKRENTNKNEHSTNCTAAGFTDISVEVSAQSFGYLLIGGQGTKVLIHPGLPGSTPITRPCQSVQQLY